MGRCVLCQMEEESTEHLFFKCKFTSCVWSKMQKTCLVYRGTDGWREELAWLCHHWTSSTFANKLRTIYKIWQTRNMQIYKGIRKSEMQVTEEIVEEVSMVAGIWRNVEKTKENWSLAVEWGLPQECFKNVNSIGE